MDNTQVFILGCIFGVSLILLGLFVFKDLIVLSLMKKTILMKIGEDFKALKLTDLEDTLQNYTDLVNDYLNILMKGKELMEAMLRNPKPFGIDAKSEKYIKDLLSGVDIVVNELKEKGRICYDERTDNSDKNNL